MPSRGTRQTGKEDGSISLKKLCPICHNIMGMEQELCDTCQAKGRSRNKARHKAKQEHRQDLELQKIYKTDRWRKVRQLALDRTGGLCEQCLREGFVNYADDVHHKVPLRLDPSKAYDLENLQPLCRAHHRLADAELQRAGGTKKV